MSAPFLVRIKGKSFCNAAHQLGAIGISAYTLQKDITTWRQWEYFFFFFWHYHQPIREKGLHILPPNHREEGPSRSPCIKLTPYSKQSVEQYLSSVGEIFAAVGTQDPRLDNVVSLKLRLGQQLEANAREDTPPSLVRPLQIYIPRCFNATAQGEKQ